MYDIYFKWTMVKRQNMIAYTKNSLKFQHQDGSSITLQHIRALTTPNSYSAKCNLGLFSVILRQIDSFLFQFEREMQQK